MQLNLHSLQGKRFGFAFNFTSHVPVFIFGQCHIRSGITLFILRAQKMSKFRTKLVVRTKTKQIKWISLGPIDWFHNKSVNKNRFRFFCNVVTGLLTFSDAITWQKLQRNNHSFRKLLLDSAVFNQSFYFWRWAWKFD